MRYFRNFAVLLVMMSVVSFATADWVVWEDFDSRPWVLEPWPMTEGSQIAFDHQVAISGSSSLRTTINAVGWGGALKLRNAPTLPAAKQGMTVSIRCEATAGASGVPQAKLEVYHPETGASMGSPDTPLKVGEWTTIRVPASAMTSDWSGCGVIFLEGSAKGVFKVWVDALTLDGAIWEDFESEGDPNPWIAANIDGTYRLGIVGNEYKKAPPLDGGNAMVLSWSGDSDGAELKKRFATPMNLREWKRLRVRLAVPPDSVSPRVSLWLWDGQEGSMAVGEPVIPTGQWVDRVFDLPAAAGKANLGNVVDLGLVFHDYPGKSGEVIIDRLDVEATVPAASGSSRESGDGTLQWNVYEPNQVMRAAQSKGKVIVYVRSAQTPRCHEFEQSILKHPRIATALAGHPLAYLNVDSPENTRLSAEIGVVRVPALVVIEGDRKARQLVVDPKMSHDEVIAFLDR